MTHDVMEAADTLADDGIEAEVIDVTTLRPLDADTILSSVDKTGRCVVVHEAPLTGGYGAEIAAQIADRGLFSLLAPVKRVAGYDTVMPLPKLEARYMPGQARIIAAARAVLADQ
jgi:pyruvate dehydrogenase E1 component beta subunit